MVCKFGVKCCSFESKRDVLEVKEDVRMKRIFKLVLRKKRSLRVKMYTTMNGFVLPEETPEWVIAHMRDLQGSQPKKIAVKTLKQSDVNIGEARLLIPFSILIDQNFLNPEELQILEDDRNRTKKIGVPILVVDQRGAITWKLILKRWDMQKRDSKKVTKNYVLNSGWNYVVEENELKKDDEVTIWSFRSEGVLCFAIASPPINSD